MEVEGRMIKQDACEVVVEVGEGSSSETPEEYLDHLQRLQAEFTNYRRRTKREKDELSAIAKGELIKRLLPVIDNIRRAADSTYGDNGRVSEAVVLIHRELEGILKEEGLERIRAKDARFDPTFHEAMMIELAEDEHRDRVLEELEAGYLFRGRLLRPSKVKVGK
jgi:molecular chaperone GrpE